MRSGSFVRLATEAVTVQPLGATRIGRTPKTIGPPRRLCGSRAPRHFTCVTCASAGGVLLEPQPAPSATALSAQQLVVRHFTDLAGGVSDDDGTRRDVAEHDGARADERLLAYLDPRQQHRSAADPRAAPDGRALA